MKHQILVDQEREGAPKDQQKRGEENNFRDWSAVADYYETGDQYSTNATLKHATPQHLPPLSKFSVRKTKAKKRDATVWLIHYLAVDR